jgi:hypothetical protein
VLRVPPETSEATPVPIVSDQAAFVLLDSGLLARLDPATGTAQVVFDPGPAPEAGSAAALVTRSGRTLLRLPLGLLLAVDTT